MKIHALTTLAFITASGVKAQVVENPCVICPNGATAGDKLVPGADVGALTTCKQLIKGAPLVETGTLLCASYGFYAGGAMCCPPLTPPQDPCTLCFNWVTVADDIAIRYGCSYITTGLLSQFELESDMRTFIGVSYEFICCPTPHENPCNICPIGATAGDYIDPYSFWGGSTCMDLITQAKQHETGSNAEAYVISCYLQFP